LNAESPDYEVTFSARAKRDMQAIPPRIIPAIIEFVYRDLARNPQRVGFPLRRELEGKFSARRGPYRITYTIDEASTEVQILRVNHRTDVYRPD